ncbi:FAD-binding domain-containing protein [Ceratobasidium sp. AG-I]|nr:FAD-binding domain-containing protein [Ceratobasidium sp. AG-I]
MSPIDSSALAALRAALSLSASVNLPGDPSYTIKRWALNAEKPASAVACPATPEDVVQILAFVQGKAPYATQQKLALAVKGGGHTPSGASSTDGGLVIDLQPNMNKVRVDPESKLAYVGGGCLWEDVDEATIKHDLASVSGTVSHTGVGGLILGGGFGWLSSQHGLVIDNLVQVTLVTSSGDILTASDSQNQDLFWAVRGGGGNFGVVTEFVLKLHDQRPDLYASTLIFPPPLLEKIVLEVNAWLAERTPTENAFIIFGVGPTGHPGIVLQLVYNGDTEEGTKKFQRFVDLGPVMNISETISYPKLNMMNNNLVGHGDFRLLQGNFIPIIPQGIPVAFVASSFSEWLKFVTENPAATKSVNIIELYHPGKWSSVPADATAYFHRRPTYNIVHIIHWTDPTFTEQATPATLAFGEAFVKSRNNCFPPELVEKGGGYINYFDTESRTASKEFAHSRFGSNLPQLIQAKRKHDPSNLFGRWIVAPAEF